MQPRPWYQKKRYLIPLGVLGLVLVAGFIGGSSTPTSTPEPSAVEVASPATSVTPEPAQTTATAPVQTQTVTNIQAQTAIPVPASDTTYTNVDGNQVSSPTYAPSAPAGATAQCNDGTYSFSQHRNGTCSHHGGVAQWL
jgi:hypothetical protein